DIRFFCGRATPEMARVPFSILRDLFSNRFEIQESDTPPLARQKLERGFVELRRVSTGESLPQAHSLTLEIHFIGQLLGLDFSASPWLKPILNDADQIRHRAFNYLSSFFSTITQTSSAVATMMMLEDVHWSDEGSLEFLEHLAHHCQDVPLMIVC